MESKVIAVELRFDSWVKGRVDAWLWRSDMITKLVDAFFGCWHNHYSFPITMKAASRKDFRPSTAAALTGMYVVCLDCGRELPYDWKEMKVIGSPSAARHYAQELVTREAA
jgi:hypothetical protein